MMRILLLYMVVLFTACLALERDLGTPVRQVNWGQLHPGATADGKPSLLATFGQHGGGLFVTMIDLDTGHCRQFAVKDAASTYPVVSFRSQRSGILYIGSAWDGHLHRFDPASPERGVEDLGPLDPEGVDFPTSITETPDGMIFIGATKGARLVRFDPVSKAFTRFGRMDDIDENLGVLAGEDGSLAGLIQYLRPHLVVIDPRSGEHRQLGPVITDNTDRLQSLKLFKGTDGLLYLSSHEGSFRIEGMHIVPVARTPSVMPGSSFSSNYEVPLVMPGGWIAQLLDDDLGLQRQLLLTNTDPKVPSRTLTLDWQGGGTALHVMDVGPDGRIYGSTLMPNRMFVATPDGQVVKNLGRFSFADGEAYSMATMGNKLYLASYPGGRLSVYDPTLPWHFGTNANDNPREFGRLDSTSWRPNALLAAPDGRLWMGSAPISGQVGGTLTWFDPRTGDRKSHRPIVPETTPASLLWLPKSKQILVGLSIEVGYGAAVKRLAGAFAIWDPTEDRLVWSGDLGLENLADVCSLALADNGLVYALIGRGDQILTQGAPDITPRLVLLDPVKRKVVAEAWLPEDFGPLAWHGFFALRTAPSGTIYGATTNCVFRIKPGTCTVERVWQKSQPRPREGTVWRTAVDPNVIDVVGPIIGNELYFGSGWRLRALTLPEE